MALPLRVPLLVLVNASLAIAALSACSASTEPTSADEGVVTGAVDSELKTKCTGGGSSGYGGNGTCFASVVATCGSDTREIDCSCPESTCTCLLNGVATKTFKTSVCSSGGSTCNPSTSDRKKCGL